MTPGSDAAHTLPPAALPPAGAPRTLVILGATGSIGRSTARILELHPEAFRRAQQEIDAVVGRSRLPDFDDRANLPDLDCVLSEVLRCACHLRSLLAVV